MLHSALGFPVHELGVLLEPARGAWAQGFPSSSQASRTQAPVLGPPRHTYFSNREVSAAA